MFEWNGSSHFLKTIEPNTWSKVRVLAWEMGWDSFCMNKTAIDFIWELLFFLVSGFTSWATNLKGRKGHYSRSQLYWSQQEMHGECSTTQQSTSTWRRKQKSTQMISPKWLTLTMLYIMINGACLTDFHWCDCTYSANRSLSYTDLRNKQHADQHRP